MTTNKKMTEAELKKEIISFLKENKCGALATCGDDQPRCSPVRYFVGDEMDIYILSAGGDKFSAIAQNPNVCLLVNTDYDGYRKIKGVQIFGVAQTSLANPRLKDEAYKKCPNPEELHREGEALAVIKIIPDEVVYLDALKTGDRTKQILKDNKVTLKLEDRVLIY